MTAETTFKYRQLMSCKCFRMRKAARLITQFYDKKLSPSGIKITQFSILSSLASGKTMSVSELSDELFIDRTTLTRSLDRLNKLELIEKVKSHDARHRLVRLTEKGYETLDHAIPLWTEAEEEIFSESKKYKFAVI